MCRLHRSKIDMGPNQLHSKVQLKSLQMFHEHQILINGLDTKHLLPKKSEDRELTRRRTGTSRAALTKSTEKLNFSK
jgi:hypothetical protein